MRQKKQKKKQVGLLEISVSKHIIQRKIYNYIFKSFFEMKLASK